MAKPTIAPTLNSRLACACDCAYGISSKDGSYCAPAIYHAGVNWVGTPTAISAPKASQPSGPRINACLVGLNQDGIIIAFRGTLPPAWTLASIEDWWQDIVESGTVAHSPLPGKVHEGFWDALETIWAGVLTEVKNLRASNRSLPVYVTGHSKGGPLASIGAARLLLESSIPATQVVTFASPHPGDATFVSQYPANLPVIRFENYLDIVPLIPPADAFFKFFHSAIPTSWQKEFCKVFPHLCKALSSASKWNYAAIGNLNYVTSSGSVVGATDYQANVDYRLFQIFWKLFKSDVLSIDFADLAKQAAAKPTDTGLTRIGAAHCIACQSSNPTKLCAGGYMTGAGGNPICPAP